MLNSSIYLVSVGVLIFSTTDFVSELSGIFLSLNRFFISSFNFSSSSFDNLFSLTSRDLSTFFLVSTKFNILSKSYIKIPNEGIKIKNNLEPCFNRKN